MSVILPRDRPNEIILAATFGLLSSHDAGATWQYACETEATRNGRLYMLGPPPGNRLYATSDTGAAVSVDDGCTWTLGTGALDGMPVFDVFPDPVDPMRVVALASGAVTAELGSSAYLSTDGGITYTGPVFTAPLSSVVTGVETAGTAAMYVTFYEIPGFHPRLARSDDAGATWTTLDLELSLGQAAPYVAAVDRDDPRKVYLRLSGTTPDFKRFESIAITTDAGESWAVPLTVRERLLTAFLRRRDGTIFVTASVLTDGSSSPLGFRSDDGGATFVEWPLSIRASGLGERDGTLFVAADNYRDGFALARSEDDGVTWTPVFEFENVNGIRPCVRESCQYDCDLLAGDTIFPPETCNPIPDAGTDGGPRTKEEGCGCEMSSVMSAKGGFAMLAAWLAATSLALCRRGKRRR